MRDFLPPQLSFGLGGFLFGDIDENPAELIAGAGVVGTRPSPNPDPAQPAIRKNYTNVRYRGLVPCDCPPQHAGGHLAILGVDCRHKRIAREGHIARQSEHRPAMLGGPYFVSRSIELP